MFLKASSNTGTRPPRCEPRAGFTQLTFISAISAFACRAAQSTFALWKVPLAPCHSGAGPWLVAG
jgi:hypothetical protein